jgi:biopolymer transport protein ExbD
MTESELPDDALTDEDRGPVLPRRPVRDTADLDITPMIDITFLLLIFFLVASNMADTSPVDLPPARHGGGVSERTSVIFTVAEGGGASGSAEVFLGDGKQGERLADDHAEQKRRIIQSVEEGFLQDGKTSVLVKAEKGVRHREVSRVSTAAAAAEVEGLTMHLGVLEIE